MIQCVNSGCNHATTEIPIPPVGGTYCHDADQNFSFYQGVMTESALSEVQFMGITLGCAIFNFGQPTSCPNKAGGSYGDCCSAFCYADEQPLPASCID